MFSCDCIRFYFFFFFKQKTAYEMRISDWSSDVCSSDLSRRHTALRQPGRSLSRGLLPSRWLALSSKADRGKRRPFRRHPDVVVSLRANPPSEQNLSVPHLGVSMMERRARLAREIGSAHVLTPVTNAQLVCRLLLAK